MTGICHLEWFINSKCDYTCKYCTPHGPDSTDKPDLPIEARLEALKSFAGFAAEKKCEAHITLYPRQAGFNAEFSEVLTSIGAMRRHGLIGQVTCANRGDLPADKIQSYREGGVDACRLTIDGPEPIQNDLRRDNSFRDTLNAFRDTRAAGIRVIPLMIMVKHNAAYLVQTMKLMLDEGFEDFILQAGIRGDVHGAATLAANHESAGSPWNHLLTAAQYRGVLLDALGFLDSEPSQKEFRRRFILTNQMYALLFNELGRSAEYEELMDCQSQDPRIEFSLKADGVVQQPGCPEEIGRFPGNSFKKIYESSHHHRWFRTADELAVYKGHKQKTFAACSTCHVSRHCKPSLVATQEQRLFYQPDTHCWVNAEAERE